VPWKAQAAVVQVMVEVVRRVVWEVRWEVARREVEALTRQAMVAVRSTACGVRCLRASTGRPPQPLSSGLRVLSTLATLATPTRSATTSASRPATLAIATASRGQIPHMKGTNHMAGTACVTYKVS